jgi:hypothetical protein
VSVVNHGRALKFVKVAPHGDDHLPAYGRAIKPSTDRFTITCRTLVLGDDDGGNMALVPSSRHCQATSSALHLPSTVWTWRRWLRGLVCDLH